MSGLDDFFAKKDKKKKTSKSGFSKANTDVIAKNLEVQRHKDAESEHSEPLATTIGNQVSHESTCQLFNPESVGVKEGDDEWYDYDPEEKDYTGLKIEALNIAEQGSNDDENDDQQNDMNQDAEKKDGGASVWSGGKLGEGVESAANSKSDTNNTSKNPSLTASKPPASSSGMGGSNAYVPPEKLKAMNSALGKTRKPKVAPDINSQIYFPSLSSSVIPCEDESRRHKFEEVRGGGGGSSHSYKSEAPQLALDNKFSALLE